MNDLRSRITQNVETFLHQRKVNTFEQYCDASSRIFHMFKDQNGNWSVENLVDSPNGSRRDASTTMTMVVLEKWTTEGLIPRLKDWITSDLGVEIIRRDLGSVAERVKTVTRTAPVRPIGFMAVWKSVYAILLGALRTGGKDFLPLAVASCNAKLLDVVQDWSENGLRQGTLERCPSTSYHSLGESTCWSLAPTAATDPTESTRDFLSETLADTQLASDSSHESLSSAGGDLADQAGFTQNLRGLIGNRERKRNTAEDELTLHLKAERADQAELEARLNAFTFPTTGDSESFFRRGSIASSTTSSRPPSIFDEHCSGIYSRRSSISSQGSTYLPGSDLSRSTSSNTTDDDEWRKACDDNIEEPMGYVSRY